MVATDVNYFVAEWNCGATDGTKGMMIFQGVPGKEGNTDVVNGTRIQIDQDGTVIRTVTFKATRFS